MEIKVKRIHPNAKLPIKGTSDSAGYDLFAIERIEKEKFISYDTGLAIQIPKGYVGLLFPRSSITNQPVGFGLRNCVGVLDPDYTGAITFRFSYPQKTFTVDDNFIGGFYPNMKDVYQIGDRIGQLVVVPAPEYTFSEVKELDVTDRGSGGYGSTGSK